MRGHAFARNLHKLRCQIALKGARLTLTRHQIGTHVRQAARMLIQACSNPRDPVRLLALASLLCGAVVLALQPAVWLVGTWYRDGYDGVGWLAAALTAALFLWSWHSPRQSQVRASVRPLLLLLLAALLRLASQVLDINVIGALLLGVDVYALAALAGLDQRRRRIAPGWLALLFCFSLPVEPMAQRLVGYDLQLISATVACTMLWPFVEVLSCEGVRLVADGQDVLVDLPCSGAELLSLTALIFTAINAVRCPRPTSALGGAVFAVLLGLLGNGLRICLLALGIVHAEALPFHVMDPLPHTLIGLTVVALVALGLTGSAACYRSSAQAPVDSHQKSSAPMPHDHLGAAWPRAAALLFLPVALLIGALQPRPVDVSAHISPPEMPLVVAGFLQRAQALSAQERSYFEQYGGSAARAAYGPFGLLLVSTASPLRHLHDPTICLSGAGFEVQLLGTDHVNRATLYRAESSDTDAYSYWVRVSYISDAGVLASSVSEVIWHWLRQPQSRWTMVQRIAPTLVKDTHEWELAVRRAFNLQDQTGV